MASDRDILASQEGLNGRPSDDHQTDPPSAPPTDSLTGFAGEGRSVGRTDGQSVLYGWISPCRYCGLAEMDHICAIAWRWEVAVPDDPAELVLYLRTVWGIRWAAVVGLEFSGDAVRIALEIIGNGKTDGSVYKDPAGLIVKLARRAQNAINRARRRQG